MESKRFFLRIPAILFLVFSLQAVRIGVNAFLPQAVLCNEAGPFGWSAPPLGLLLLGIFALVFLALQWWREPNFKGGWPWLLLIAAGLSNLGERLVYRCVTDYFFLGFSFNIADALLTLGVIGLLWRWHVRETQSSKPQLKCKILGKGF